MTLLIAPCSYEAAKHAVEHWHYSKVLPRGKIVKYGVWENEKFIGCVLFSRGANNNIGKPYKLRQIEICELTRVALTNHAVNVSKIVSICVKQLSKDNPKMRLIVSYADPAQDHHGGIYQAMNWVYVGSSKPQLALRLKGVIVHKRTGNSKYGTISGLPRSDVMWKHKYLYPLDRAMRKQIEPLAQPYPKRNNVRTADGSSLVTNEVRQFDSDPFAYENE